MNATIDPNFDYEAKVQNDIAEKTREASGVMNGLPSYEVPEDGWGTLPKTADYFGVSDLSLNEAEQQYAKKEYIRQSTAQLNLDNAYRTLYAYTKGKENAGVEEKRIQEDIEKNKRIFGDKWTEDMEETFYSNMWKKKYDELQYVWGAGSHVEKSLNTLRRLSLDTSLSPNTLFALGIVNEVKEKMPTSFSRSWELSSFSNELKQDYFKYATDDKDYDLLTNQLQRAEWLFKQDDDSSVASFLGESGDMLLGGIDRSWGGWGKGIASLTVAGVASALSGNPMPLQAWGAYTFGRDTYDTMKSGIAYNAMHNNPELSKTEAFNDKWTTLASAGGALLNTFGVGIASSFALKSINKLLAKSTAVDMATLAGIDSVAVKTARNKAIQAEVLNTAKTLGISEGVNVGVGGLTAMMQQLAVNAVSQNKETWDQVSEAVSQGVKASAIFGLIPAPFEAVRLGVALRHHNQASEGLLQALNKKLNDSVIQNTDAYKKDGEGFSKNIQDLEGFHETRTYININEARAWGKSKGINIDKTPLGKKIAEAESGGATEISLSLEEQAKLKNGRWQEMVDDLGRTHIDDMSPLELREQLSPEEKAKVEEIARQVKEKKEQFEQEIEDGGKQIASDMYKQMDGLPLEPEQKDAVIGMNIEFFKSLSTTYGIPIKELWQDLGMRWEKFKSVLQNNPDEPRKHAGLRGNYDPQRGVISLGNGADMATVVHEYAHFALDSLMKLAVNRSSSGRSLGKLENVLNNTFGKDWRDIYTNEKRKAELEALQEKFAYQFLDYVAGIETSGSSAIMRSIKNFIVNAERRRFAETFGKDAEFTGAQKLLDAEYKSRYGHSLPKRSAPFDALAHSLFEAQEIVRKLDEDYGSESISRLMPEAVLEEARRKNPDDARTIEQATAEIEEANEKAENVIATELLKQSGYMFSFNDGFIRRWREFSKDKKLIKEIVESSKEAKAIFRKAREEITKRIDTGVIGNLYKAISESKVRDGKSILDLRKEGLLTETQYKALKDRGIIVKDGGRLPEDFYGRVSGTKSREIVKDKRFAEMLLMMLEFPTKEELVFSMAMDHVVRNLKARQDLVQSNSKLRTMFLEKRQNAANSNARILETITHTPADKVGVIKAVARKLVMGTRLDSLKDSDALRRAKNARRETERAVARGDFARAGMENRAERVNITIATMVSKVRTHLRDQIKKHGKILSDEKKSAQNGYDNKILDLARFIADKNNIRRDKKGITLDTLTRYAKEIPELQDLMDKYQDYLTPRDSLFNRTVGECYDILDVINDIETTSRNYRSAVIDGKRIDLEAKQSQVIDSLLYEKYGTDTKGHKRGDFVLDANGNKVPLKGKKSLLLNKEGQATAEVTTLGSRFSLLKDQVRQRLGRVLNWCGKMDGKDAGMCSEMLYHLVGDATSRAKIQSNRVINQISNIVSKPKWKSEMVVANELIDKATNAPLIFGTCQGIYGNAGYHLLGFLMQMGNEENWSKMLLAQGWEETQVMSFINRMIDEGYITRDTLDVLNKVWALFDKEFDKANDAYYSMHGRFIKKVEPRQAVFDMKDGGAPVVLTGGYAPLIRDRFRNGTFIGEALDLSNLKPDHVEGNLFFEGGISTNATFMNERTKSVYFVDFNPQHLLAVAPRVASYTELMPAVRAAYSFWRRPEIQKALNKVDPSAYKNMIEPFILRSLKRSAELQGDVFGSKIVNKIANNVGMNIMCLNIANAVTQTGGVFNAMQAVKPKYLVESFCAEFTGFNKLKDAICSDSAMMQDRIKESSSHLIETVNRITSNTESAGIKNKALAAGAITSAFQQKQAYMFQKWIQDRLDVAIFNGAYKQEVARIGKKTKADLTEAEHRHAVRVAEEAVIKTQSSSNTLDKSAFETSSPVSKVLFQFCNYFLTATNYQLERWGQLSRSNAGMLTKIKVMLPFFMLGMVLPNYYAGAISKTARGDWWNDDLSDTENYLGLFLFEPIVGVANSVPLAGNLVRAVLEGMVSDQKTTTNIMNAPTISYINNIVNVFNRAMFDGELDYRTTRALSDALALIFSMPFLSPVGKLISNYQGVRQRDINPDGGAIESARAIAFGARSDEKSSH